MGHLHGVNTGLAGEPDDLATAKDLMRTCYEMYARTPTGLASEIVFFETHGDGADFPKQHAHDVGGGDFTIKPQVGALLYLSRCICNLWVACHGQKYHFPLRVVTMLTEGSVLHRES